MKRFDIYQIRFQENAAKIPRTINGQLLSCCFGLVTGAGGVIVVATGCTTGSDCIAEFCCDAEATVVAWGVDADVPLWAEGSMYLVYQVVIPSTIRIVQGIYVLNSTK